MSAAVLGWATEALVASALLMALVLALRGPVRRTFGAQAAYALWALPVLRLALPPLPAAWQDLTVAPVMARAREQVVVLIASPPPTPMATQPAVETLRDRLPSVGTLLLAAWLFGIALFLLVQWLTHSRFCHRLLSTRHALDRIGSVEVIASDAAPGPLAFGVWRRYVAVPRDFAERYDSRERSLALAHELGHHLRGDLLANWIALVVLALHWFNPLAWRAMRAFRADQEMANDARVLAAATPELRHAYACAIVKAAHGRALSPTCHLNTVADLKGRLRMLTRSTSRRRALVGSGAVAALTLAALGVTASGTATAAKVRAGVGRIAPIAEMPAMPVMASMPAMPAATQDYLPPAPPPPAAPHPALPPIPAVAPPAPPTPEALAAPIVASIPQVVPADCTSGTDHDLVLNQTRDGKHRIVICTNRIQKVAQEGQAAGARGAAIRERAMADALSSLRATRAGLAANRDMSAAVRRDVLADMDQSIAELQTEIASGDD